MSNIRSLEELLVEQQQATPGGSKGTLGKRAFLNDKPKNRAPTVLRPQLPPLASSPRSTDTAVVGHGRGGLGGLTGPGAAGPGDGGVGSARSGPTADGAATQPALDAPAESDVEASLMPSTTKASNGRSTPSAKTHTLLVFQTPRVPRSKLLNIGAEEAMPPPTSLTLPPLAVAIPKAEVQGPLSASSTSGGSKPVTPRSVRGGGDARKRILRGDLQQFMDRLAKESEEAPHLNVPHLLASFLPKIGLDNLGDILDRGSNGGSSSVLPITDVSESNVFLSTDRTPLAPFVGHMPFMSMSDSESGDGGTGDFQSISLEGALLFIDISGFSKICSALQAHGAHAISHAVNSYMERILSIVVGEYHGDVLKFAGDAVMVTWTYEADMERSCLSAARCALKLQAECGQHPVETPGTRDEKLSFRIHVGVTLGTLHSDVFQPKFSAAMQKAYHFVHGPAFSAIGHLVDAAKSGEVCCCQAFTQMTEQFLEFTKVTEMEFEGNETWGVFRVEAMTPAGEEELALLAIDDGVGDGAAVVPDRPRGTEAQFIHPSIVKKLQFGIKASHLAEMRLLCVLFINMTNKDASVTDWFYESQEILDAQRCPIVQIIEDDKGVHLVAAVNLFVAEANPTMVGIAAARALMEGEVECTVGMAAGVTFCGIVGSSDACRWDITGSACVRAARLMQFASNNPKAKGAKVIIDSSLMARCTDYTQLREVANDVELKGTADPITVFTLSEATNEGTFRILRGDQLFPDILPDPPKEMVNAVSPSVTQFNRGIGVITGPIGSGKKSTAVRVGAHFGCTAILHPTTRGAPGLSVAKTLAGWYEHHADSDLSKLSKRLRTSFQQHFISRTMHLALELVTLTLAKGISTCLVVHHAHFLDSYSLSLLKQIHASPKTEGGGRWLTMLTHYPLYGSPTAWKLAQSVKGSKGGKEAQIVPMMQYDVKQQNVLFQAGVYIFKPGGVPAFVDRAGSNIGCSFATDGFMRRSYFANVAEAKATGKPLVEFSRIDLYGRGEMLLRGTEAVTRTPWTVISPDFIARITQQYDVLPPRHQMVLRVLAAVTRQNPFFLAPVSMVGQITLQLVSKRSAKEISHDIQLLTDLLILDLDTTKNLVSFRSPAMRDMVDSLLTPAQAEMINKRCGQLYLVPPFYQEDDPMLLLTIARFLRHGSGPKPFLVLSTSARHQYLEFLRKAWQIMEPSIEKKVGSMDAHEQYIGYINCDFSKELNYELRHVEGLGCLEALGVAPDQACKFEQWFGGQDKNESTYAHGPSLDPVIVDVKNYWPPLSLGPLVKVLSVIALGMMTRYYEANRLAAGLEGGVREIGMSYHDVCQYSADLISVYIAGVKRFEELVPRTDDLFSPRNSGAINPQVELQVSLTKEKELLESMLAPGQTAEQYVEHARSFLSDYAVNVVKPRAERATRWLSSAEVRLPPPLEGDPFGELLLLQDEKALEDQQRMMRRAFDCLTVVKNGDDGSSSPIIAAGSDFPRALEGSTTHFTRSRHLVQKTFSSSSAMKLELDDSKFHESLMCLAVEHWTPILPAIMAAKFPLPEGSRRVKHVPQMMRMGSYRVGINASCSMLEGIRDGYLKDKDISIGEYRAYLYLYCVM